MSCQLEPSGLNPSFEAISVSALDGVELPRHRWYFLKEAFSPHFVRRAALDAQCEPDDVIVDPFCGSGTVSLQAALDGFSFAGTEVNPFLAFVARAKLLQCKPQNLDPFMKIAVRGARKGRKSPLAGFSTFAKKRGLSKWLFNREILEAFEGAWQTILEPTNSATPRRLMKLCLLGAAMDVCNAVKDGKCLRYRSDWEERAFDAEDFINALETRVKVVKEDLESTPLESTRVRIRSGDVRKSAVPGPFRLCITSPPYLNSFDYTDVYRPELFLGKWVRDMTHLRALRHRTMRSHVQVKWKDPVADNFGDHYRESIRTLRKRKNELWNARIPEMIQAYFEDMGNVLRDLRVSADENASAWIVVSTSAYAGIEIPVDLIIADIASTSGWFLREVNVLRYLSRVSGQQWSALAQKKTNGPHLRESLIILDAKPLLAGKHDAEGRLKIGLHNKTVPRRQNSVV